MIKILKFNYPFLTAHQTDAILCGILSNYKEALPWLYNYFIQIIGLTHYKSGFLLFNEACISWNRCPFLDVQMLNRSFLFKMAGNRSVNDIFINCIDNGYYINTMLNRFYIPDTREFNNYHHIHSTFIFGYNKKKKIFYIADFDKNGKYHISKTIPFSSTDKAFSDIDLCNNLDWLSYYSTRTMFEVGSNVILLKYRANEYYFDIDLLSRLVTDYLESKVTIQSYEEEKELKERGAVYGIENYNFLKDCMEYIKVYKKFNWNTTKAFYLMYNHKKMMLLRIDYMKQNGFLKNVDCIKFKNIEEKTLIMLNLFLKYYLSGNEKCINDISQMLDEIYLMESTILKQFLKNIILKKQSSISQFEKQEINRFNTEILGL